jgi:hypothetical protein
MTDQNQPPAPKRRVQRNSAAKFVIGLLFLFVAALGIMVVFFPDSLEKLTAWTNRSDSVTRQQPSVESSEELLERQQDGRFENSSAASVADDSDRPAGPSPSETIKRPEQPELPTILPVDPTGSEAAGLPESNETSRESDCSRLASGVEAFFDTLDTRPYLQPFQLEKKSSVYFPELIQKLVDNPPVVTGETDDLFTILQNTAHFFRIIGKHNILVLKGILDRERETFEQVLADFYQLTKYPDCLEQRFNLEIGNDPLYQYASFFLNTMGGRLYLFRRDSMSRMVVSYYAILTIDQANREGRNKYGIDIGPAIDRLIAEIESSNIDLRMRDHYLETLYELEEKYQ